ncbi:MAG: hypothetical protein A2Y33_04545 [Spirochaetes bacterium GWF1_51_8]|nr:MAG: hypothetical protein A2Y33_04545 [Spirochaetes bacterium GWF1_51_8]
MKRFAVILSAIAALFTLSCGSDYVKPGDSIQAVTFSFFEPDAVEVFLAGEMNNWNPKALPMDCADGSNWTATVYLKDGIWQYKFVADGTWIADPNNPNTIDDGYGGLNSLAVIGKVTDGFLFITNIPHGTVKKLGFASGALGAAASFNIYLPPDYSTTTNTYPVLFLLHGYGQNEDQWTKQGHIENYMDFLLSGGKIEPFIIVMPAGGKSFYTNKVEKYITDELYNYIKKNYRIKPGKENTAITGMSMGGFGAFYLAQRNPGLFGLSIPLSGYFDEKLYLEVIRDKPLPVDFQLEIYCGTEDRLCFKPNEDLKAILVKNQVKFGYYAAPGDHSWHYWRGIIKEVLGKVSDFFNPGD